MRLLLCLLVFNFFIGSCQNDPKTNPNDKENKKSDNIPLGETLSIPESEINSNNNKISTHKLTLTKDAIQVVNISNGSTKEIGLGISYDSLITIVNRVLSLEPISQDVNKECGAGPLKMATWSNGLTLVFIEKKTGKEDWTFAGWFATKPKEEVNRPTTMAGIGVGSSIKELKSAYVVTVKKSTLGQEFSVQSGFYGILSGSSETATIEAMWSGANCNFR